MRLLRGLVLLVVFGLAVGLGAALVFRLFPRAPGVPDPPAVAFRIREVARLEALEVTLYKKIDFSPDPAPAGSFWGDVAGWLKDTFNTPRGRAIVFADATLGLDLSKLDASSVRVIGKRVELTLPPLTVKVALRPADTEVIGSNLDSAQTARLLELARAAFEREVRADRALQARARESAERDLRALLLPLGFTEVTFGAAPQG
ncbi:MAG: DUF4230 domain-containing protein [Anaeromyxobacter sp.]